MIKNKIDNTKKVVKQTFSSKIIPKKQNLKFVIRFIIGATFFMLGLSLSSSIKITNPDYQIYKTILDTFVAITAGLIGFFLIPGYIVAIKNWIENIIVRTTYNTVSDFWNQYTVKLEQNRKSRAQDKNKAKAKKLQEKYRNTIILDTSVLIDGRVVEIAKTGFIKIPLVVPKVAIDELHLLSDNKNKIKRAKGRRGLDMINELKKHTKVYIYTDKDSSSDVDKELIKIAKEYKASIMTLDYNLNKVAQVSNIEVLNINTLAEAIKPLYIPGEQLKIKVIQEGKEKNQGLGYLQDGTMIVVSEGKRLVGKEVDVKVDKIIQSPAGKMIFTSIV